MDEKDYRLLVREAFERIELALENVDPDLLEVEPGMGSLAFLSKKGKTVLSTQPSVRQIWLAAASEGIALHFSWNPEEKKWLDDRGEGKELFAFLGELFQKISGLKLSL